MGDPIWFVAEHALRSKTPVTNKNDSFTKSRCNPNAASSGSSAEMLCYVFLVKLHFLSNGESENESIVPEMVTNSSLLIVNSTSL